LTAHHQRHFSIKGRAITPEGVPTHKCFDRFPLVFVEDLPYGAKPGKNFPDRAYVVPLEHKNAVVDTNGHSPGMFFRHMFRLPMGLHGDLVLLQWHYLTANSCNHVGYDDYGARAILELR